MNINLSWNVRIFSNRYINKKKERRMSRCIQNDYLHIYPQHIHMYSIRYAKLVDDFIEKKNKTEKQK